MSVFDVTLIRSVHEGGIFILGLEENEYGSGASLIFQIAGEFDEDDVARGWDTYCLSFHDARNAYSTVYGGIESCELDHDEVRLRFTERAAREHGLPVVSEFRLRIPADQFNELSSGLRRLRLTT